MSEEERIAYNKYQNDRHHEAVFSIENGEMINGELPKTAKKFQKEI